MGCNMCNKKKTTQEKFENNDSTVSDNKWIIALILLILIIIVLHGFMKKDKEQPLFVRVPKDYFGPVLTR